MRKRPSSSPNAPVVRPRGSHRHTGLNMPKRRFRPLFFKRDLAGEPTKTTTKTTLEEEPAGGQTTAEASGRVAELVMLEPVLIAIFARARNQLPSPSSVIGYV